MAKKNTKSQAQKAAAAKSRKPANKTAKTNNKQQEPLIVPARLVISLVCIGLFIIFLVIFLQPDGILVKDVQG